MKWVITLFIMGIFFVQIHLDMLTQGQDELAIERLHYALQLASHAASVMVTDPTVSDGQITFDQTEADAVFKRTLADNLALDKTTLQPLSGSLFQTGPTIELEQFIDYSNATFPDHYVNSTYGIDTTLYGPAIVYAVQLPAPKFFHSSPSFNLQWSTIASYPDNPKIPVGNTISISGVSVDTSVWTPQFTVSGANFGNAPTAGQEAISVYDSTRGFTANNSTTSPLIQVSSWSTNSISFNLANYGGADLSNYNDGEGNLAFWPGDNLTVTVMNPQTGESSSYNLVYPTAATLPNMTVTSVSLVKVNSVQTLQGTLSFNGQPLANQSIVFSASGGTFTTGGTYITPTEYSITTDSNGNFVTTWKAPSTAETDTLTVSSDGVQQTETVKVIDSPYVSSSTWNTTTWPPQITLQGLDFGTAGTSSDLNIYDNTRSWGEGTVQYTIPSWTDTQIQVSGFTNYAQGGGQWLFAPGDSITITITNPQTGKVGTYNTTYPTNAPMPSVTLQAPSSMDGATTTTLTGTVTFQGQALANQIVNLTGSAGSFPNGSQVSTDSNGNFSIAYNAPNASESVTVTAASDTNSATATISVLAPKITSITYNTGVFPPTVTITGQGFGTSPQKDDLTIGNNSRGWVGAYQDSGVPLQAQSWTDSQIVIQPTLGGYGSGDSGTYSDGQGSWVWDPGNSLTFNVTNPQSGVATSYNSTFPSATMPTVTLNQVSYMTQNQQGTITGTVSFNGQGLNNQAVLLTLVHGAFTGGGQLTTYGPYMVWTNSSGQFSVNYTAPNATVTETITATAEGTSSTSMSFGVYEQPQVSGVSWNTGVWPPQVTVSGSGFGSSTATEYIQITDNSRSWQGGTTNSAVIFTVGTWNPNTISVIGISNYGGGSGGWIFAPGDQLDIHIVNPQDGWTGDYYTTYPSNAQMPSVSINSIPNTRAGTSQTISGRVTFNGTGLANQTVNLSTNNGSFSATSVTTDSNGNWSDTYNAGGSGGTFTVTASSDTASASTNVVVFTPNAYIFGMQYGNWNLLPPQMYFMSVYNETTGSNGVWSNNYEKSPYPNNPDVKYINGKTYWLATQYSYYGQNPEAVFGSDGSQTAENYYYYGMTSGGVYRYSSPCQIQDYAVAPNGTIYMLMSDGQIWVNGGTSIATLNATGGGWRIEYDPGDNYLFIFSGSIMYAYNLNNNTWCYLNVPSGQSGWLLDAQWDSKLNKEVFELRNSSYGTTSFWSFSPGSITNQYGTNYMTPNWGSLGNPGYTNGYGINMVGMSGAYFIVEADTGNLLFVGNGVPTEYNVFNQTEKTYSYPNGGNSSSYYIGYNPNTRELYAFQGNQLSQDYYYSYDMINNPGYWATHYLPIWGLDANNGQITGTIQAMGAPLGG